MPLIDPSRVPSGLSWGTRGFRVGKSVSGNWWVSLGLPFGFRYTWLIGGRKRGPKYPQSHQEEVITPDSIEPLPSTIEQPPVATKSDNQKILERIKNKI